MQMRFEIIRATARAGRENVNCMHPRLRAKGLPCSNSSRRPVNKVAAHIGKYFYTILVFFKESIMMRIGMQGHAGFNLRLCACTGSGGEECRTQKHLHAHRLGPEGMRPN